MLSTDVNDYKGFSHWDTNVAQFVAVARQNGIEGSDEDLYDFIRMVYKNGWDKKSIDEVIPKDKIVEEIDFHVGELAQRDGLDDNQFEDLCNYLDAHVDNARATKQNVAIAKDTIADAVGYHKNYGSDEKNLDVAIAEQMYYDFCKENDIK